jgi:hypothetical protein
MAHDADAAALRLRLALDLFEAGEAMMREVLRRREPGLSDADIETRLVAWLRERPGAPLGDAPGNAASWPRPGA